MSMDLLKTITGKVAAGVVALVVIIGAISWWRMEPATRASLVHGTGKIIAWFGIVLLLPWASFFIIARVGKMQSNLAAGLLVLGYTVLEFLLLCWLFDWSIQGAAGWTFALLGTLLAAVYNLFTCDWIAEKLE